MHAPRILKGCEHRCSAEKQRQTDNINQRGSVYCFMLKNC